MYGRETKRAYNARELLLFNDQNRIIIRDNNSIEQLDRIFRTPVLLKSDLVKCTKGKVLYRSRDRRQVYK